MDPKQDKIDQAFTALQQQLQELALVDFQAFCTMAGIDQRQAVVCMARAKGLSFAQIAIQYKIPRSTAARICEKCTENRDGKELEPAY